MPSDTPALYQEKSCFLEATKQISRNIHMTVLQLYHLPPPLPPPVSSSFRLFTQCQPLYASYCTVLLYISRYCEMKTVFFIFCVCFLCIISVKRIINLLQYSMIQLVAFVGYLCVLVAQPCPTLCNPVDCSQPGSSVQGFSREDYQNGLPFPSPGDLPNPRIESGSPTWQTDSLPSLLG